MTRKVLFFVFIFTFLLGTMTYAHSGRTDSSGGHNCSEKSKAKGLCTGYHSHNSGSIGSGGSSNSSTTNSNELDCSDFSSYEEVVDYWNSKGYSATYDPENLDGWGNGVVDDGIPCEAPTGYDKTKINNSPDQIQFHQDQEDDANGESMGLEKGFQDGYQEKDNNNKTSDGSAAFKRGYTNGYDKGYVEGNMKIESDKKEANKDGYTLGKKTDKLSIPNDYSSHSGLKKTFEDGFKKAIAEKVEEKKKKMFDLGYSDGKNDVNSPPKDIESTFIESYKEGYSKGNNELKVKYVQMGFENAYKMVKYETPELKNIKFLEWHKEGFNSNTEIKEIKDEGLSLGKEGSDFILPSKYSKAEAVFSHYYKLGYKEYEEKVRKSRQTASGGIGLAGLLWLGRRIYVAKKMIG